MPRNKVYQKDSSTSWLCCFGPLPGRFFDSVSRARKLQKFLSQPFHVAEIFTGTPGTYVKLADTVKAFGEILDGKHDDKAEQAFYMKGGIEEVK